MEQFKKFFVWTGILVLVAAVGLSGCCSTCAKNCQEHSRGGLNYSSFIYPTGSRTNGVLSVKKEGPAEIILNKPFTYKVALTNLTKCDIKNVVLTETHPNFSITDSSPKASLPGEGETSWEIATLGPKATKVIDVQAVATRSGAIQYCTSVTYDPTLCLTGNIVEPNLKLDMGIGAQDSICAAIPLKLVVKNTGSSVTRNVKVKAVLPQGLTLANGAKEIVSSIGSLNPGEAREISASLKAAKVGSYTVNATATADGDLISNAAASTSVWQPVLKIQGSGTETILIGKSGDYQIAVQNVGDGPAANVVVRGEIPSGMSCVSAGQGGSVSRGSVVWNVGTLDPDEAVSLSMKLKADDAGTFKSVVYAEGDCAQEVSDAIPIDVTGIPAILLEVIDTEDPVEVGNNTSYIITATNQGSAIGTNITITAELEANMDYVTSSGVTQAVVEGKSIRFAPLRELAPQKAATWQIEIKAVEAGDVRFSVEMKSDELTRPVTETEATRIY